MSNFHLQKCHNFDHLFDCKNLEMQFTKFIPSAEVNLLSKKTLNESSNVRQNTESLVNSMKISANDTSAGGSKTGYL